MRVVRHDMDGLGSRVVGHDNVLSGARAGDNSTVVGGAETVVGGGKRDWIMTEDAGARVVVLYMGS